MITCGETGVGKTYRSRKEGKVYLHDLPDNGKLGRKILAFDTNDDDYTQYPTVDPDQLHKLKENRPRRIRPFNKDGTPMGKEDKKEVVRKILRYYKNGLILLDDIDEYMSGEKGGDMIGALCTMRHKGVDIIFTHQSLSKITTTAWQNCTWLRLHHQVDDVSRIKERVPKYAIVRIAQLIVDEQYDLAYDKYINKEITEEEFAIRSSYFVYVNLRKQRLRGCSKAAFVRACKKYIDQEENRKLRMMLNEQKSNGKPVYANRMEAVLKLISDLLRYWEGG